MAVRVDGDGEISVAVELGGARGTDVLEFVAVAQDGTVQIPKGQLVFVLVEEGLRFPFLFDESEQLLGICRYAVGTGIRGRFQILQTADFRIVRLLLPAVALRTGQCVFDFGEGLALLVFRQKGSAARFGILCLRRMAFEDRLVPGYPLRPIRKLFSFLPDAVQI